MRYVALVVLALLLCAGSGWGRVDAEARSVNREYARRIHMYWRSYTNAIDGVYLGRRGCWHALSVAKVFLQTALNDARSKVDRRDPGSARQLNVLCTQVEHEFYKEEERLQNNILNQGDRKLRPEERR